MKYLRINYFSLTILILFLSACGVSNPLLSEDFDKLSTAQLVPPAGAQGITLFNRLSRSLSTQAISKLNISSFNVEDLDGRPFTYINFTTPTVVEDVWSYADKLTGKEWNTSEADSLYTTVITGASRRRSVVTAMTVGLELVHNIGITIRAISGKSNFKRLTSLNGLWDVMVEDQKGNYWRVNDKPELVSASDLNEAKNAYLAVRKRNNDLTTINLLEKEWSKILDQNPGQTKAGASRESIKDYTLPNGNLDLSKAAVTIAKLGELHVTSNGLKPRTTDIATQDCWPFLWWSICDPSWYGHLTRSKLPGGFIQSGWKYNLPPFQVGTGPGSGPADVMGCGPAAFISLAHWWNEYGGRSWYGKTATGYTPYYSTVSSAFATPSSYQENDGRYAPNSFAKNMAAMQPNGLPLITAQMGGFWFVSGTLVTPQGFIDGGNAWLANQKSSYGIPNSVTVHGNYNVTVGIWGPVAFFGALSANTNAFNIADAIINETGSNDRPVIAAYPTGGSAGLAAHYSPILRFHIIKGGLATVWVNPLDTFTGNASWEVNLGNINNIVSGAFYLTQ